MSSIQKRNALLQDSRTDPFHHLHFPKNNTEDFIQEPCLFLPPYIVLHRDFFCQFFSRNFFIVLRKGEDKLLHC